MNIAQLVTKGFWISVGQRLSSLLDEPGEEIALGVRKFREHESMRYVFFAGPVGDMTPRSLDWHLRVNGFFQEFRLSATLENNGKVIRLAGEGFSLNDPPRLYFVVEVIQIGGPFFLGQNLDTACSPLAYTQNNVHFEVPYPLEGQRDWDGIARAMRKLLLLPRSH